MEVVRDRDLNLSGFRHMPSIASTSTLLSSKDKILKVFNNMISPSDREGLLDKYQILPNVEGLILPEILVVNNDGLLIGYIMEKFQNSMNLNDYYSQSIHLNFTELCNVLLDVINILKKVHDEGIILQDLSFDNILINSEHDVKICDLDACEYNGHYMPFISVLYKNFISDYRGDNIHLGNPNVDKISLMLSFIYIIYMRELQYISLRDYKRLSRHIECLDEIRKILMRKDLHEIDLPYLDGLIREIVSMPDITIDRELLKVSK